VLVVLPVCLCKKFTMVEFDEKSSSGESDSEDERVEEIKGFESDLGLMAGFDVTPVDASEVKEVGLDKHLRKLATENVKLMFRDLLDLTPVEDNLSIRVLPDPKFKLPRQKPLPKPKPETRWEKYAKEKGIQNKKRERLVWDDETQTWAPRWGYGRHAEDGKQGEWMVELNDKDDDTVDKFQERRQSKKMRVLKNRQKYLRNKAEAEQKMSAAHAVENLGTDGARAGASKRGKDKVVDRLKHAQVSTASLGRFDAQMEGEGKRQRGSTKRKFEPAESTNDVDRDKKILSKLLGKHIGGPATATKEDASKKKNKKKRGRK